MSKPSLAEAITDYVLEVIPDWDNGDEIQMAVERALTIRLDEIVDLREIYPNPPEEPKP
jgi:hypothetical protein